MPIFARPDSFGAELCRVLGLESEDVLTLEIGWARDALPFVRIDRIVNDREVAGLFALCERYQAEPLIVDAVSGLVVPHSDPQLP